MSKKVKFAAEAAWDCLQAYINDPWQFELLNSAQESVDYKDLDNKEKEIWEVIIKGAPDAAGK